jgi:hypothetical protein
MPGQQTSDAVQALCAAVDALMQVPLSVLPAAAVTGLLTELETQRRRLEAVDQRLLSEIGERGIAGEYAQASPVDLLVTCLRVSPAEAKARVERARDLGPRRALSGQVLEPIFPQVAEAVRAGELSARHAEVITACIDRISAVAHPATTVAEGFLVEAARHENPRQLAATARLLLARLDPDGLEPRDRELERRRGFTLRKRADGSSEATGRLTPEVTALWETVFDSLATPVPADDLPDQRSPAQRRHDALADAATRLLRSDTLPTAGGAPVTVLARTTMAELAEGAGVAITGHGEQLSVATLLQMAADAQVIPVVCADTGGVLAYGRSRRLASATQRLALAARDGGCCFPGCNRPAAWAEVHHIREWQDGGRTDIENMCLLCRYHHRHFERCGWEVVMIDDLPHWIPPAWSDPLRRPVRNTAHHLDHFDFSSAG